MKIVTYNVNGIRAAIKKGWLEWVKESQPDILCLQEVKALEKDFPSELLIQMGYKYILWHSAEKKGYSGVAILSKIEPESSNIGIGIEEYDKEGRVLEVTFKNFKLINTYFPSGTSGDERQNFKYKFLDNYYRWVEDKIREHPNLIICGDVNICHKEIDIHNPVSNKKSSGFLPEERQWVTEFLELGFTDTFRYFDSSPHKYTWWSYRAAAREKNKGWRIDYFFNNNVINGKMIECTILPEAKHSDHCPVELVVDDSLVNR